MHSWSSPGTASRTGPAPRASPKSPRSELDPERERERERRFRRRFWPTKEACLSKNSPHAISFLEKKRKKKCAKEDTRVPITTVEKMLRFSAPRAPYLALARLAEAAPTKDHAELAFAAQGLQHVKLVVVGSVPDVGLHQLYVQVAAHDVRRRVRHAPKRRNTSHRAGRHAEGCGHARHAKRQRA